MTETISGLPTSGAKAFYLIENFYSKGRSVICILGSDESVENLEEDIRALAALGEKTAEPVVFTYSDSVNERLLTLHRLLNGRFDFLLATHSALSAGTIPRNDFSALKLVTDGRYLYDDIIRHLSSSGYTRMDYVDSEGEFSVRGEIFDIWPPNSKLPLRLVFDDTRVESIRHFEIESQRSTGLIDGFEIIPAAEFSRGGTLADYLSGTDASVFIDEDTGLSQAGAWADKPGAVKLDRLSGNPAGYLKIPAFLGNFQLFEKQLADWRKEKVNPVIFCDNQGQQDRLMEMFDEHRISDIPGIRIARLNSGFYLPGKGLCVVCYHEIFTSSGKPVRFPKFKTGPN